jgi:hypothetical protein
MNYLPYISWGIYKGGSAGTRAHAFSSWGLMMTLPITVVVPAKGWSMLMAIGIILGG